MNMSNREFVKAVKAVCNNPNIGVDGLNYKQKLGRLSCCGQRATPENQKLVLKVFYDEVCRRAESDKGSHCFGSHCLAIKSVLSDLGIDVKPL